jgi:hypothetical protein
MQGLCRLTKADPLSLSRCIVGHGQPGDLERDHFREALFRALSGRSWD